MFDKVEELVVYAMVKLDSPADLEAARTSLRSALVLLNSVRNQVIIDLEKVEKSLDSIEARLKAL